MWLKQLSILNYKNIAEAELTFSPKINCIIGQNGMGKTNLMDAVHFLSFCKSATNAIDSQNILHDADFFVLNGEYATQNDETEHIYCGMKRRQRKVFKRNKKEYPKLADHIGFIPLVIVSPNDSELISEGSEERRKFMDMVISQYDRIYLDALMDYNKAMQQRNSMLKAEQEPDREVMLLWEEVMAEKGTLIYEKRKAFIDEFTPIFQQYYRCIAQVEEPISLTYNSHAASGELLQTITSHYPKDRIMGYSMKGIHKDDLEMQLNGFPIKREGSQGQNKTYLISLKLAQFDFLRRTGNQEVPILLLDDIFDKLDASRVQQIISIVSGENFGQIFMTDTNRTHLDQMLHMMGNDHKLFEVVRGEIADQTI